ncbi:MAG: replication initiator protein A [Acidimicrobiales bacterium]
MGQAALPLFDGPDPRETLRTTGGRDELNLAEFPITLLADRVPDGCKTLEFEDTLFDQQANALVTRRLTITGSDRYGLPTAVDDEILVALIQLTKLGNNFTNRRVSFTRYELLKLLGWGDRGDSYDRIEESLNRWMGVTLYYDKAWWDKDTKSWIDAKFHVLESVFLVDQDTRRRRKARGQQELMLSWFSWNEVVFRSFQAENLKRLDVDTYFSLKSSVSKRMYRFLDKRFYHRARWEFDLKEFAREHIGLSRNYTPPKIKEKIQPALDELTAIGFLEPLSRNERFAKAGRGNWKIILIKKSAPAEQRPRKSDLSELERELVTRGVSQSKAEELVAGHAAERIRVKLEVFDWMLATKDKRVTKSPAGYLVKSIEEDYAAPKGFETKADREKREAAKQEQERREAEAKRQQKAEEARERAIRAKVTKYWSSLSVAEQKKLEAEALDQAEESAKSYREMVSTRNPVAGTFLKLIRDAHIAKLLGLSGTEPVTE